MRPAFFCFATFSVIGLIVTQLSVAQKTHASTLNPAASVNYNAYCAVCHGTDGAGSPTGKSLNAPDLRSSTVQKQSNAAIARFISEGKERMPAFKNQLTHEQIMDEVRYIRTLRHEKN